MGAGAAGVAPLRRSPAVGFVKKANAFEAFSPQAPSIIPGEKFALSSRIWRCSGVGPLSGIRAGNFEIAVFALVKSTVRGLDCAEPSLANPRASKLHRI